MTSYLHQHQAVRLIGGYLLDGTPVTLTWVRSFLSRPRYLGGKLRHQFEAKHPDGHVSLITDDQIREPGRFFRRENKLPEGGPKASIPL